MYGRDENGICLKIETLDFACSKENYEWTSQDKEKKWAVRAATPIDVIYTDKPQENMELLDVLENEEYVSRPTCMGYLKTDSWEYEHETRILARVDVQSGTRSARMSLNRHTFKIDEEYTYPDFKYINLNMNENEFGNMSIIINPFMSGAMKRVIKAGILSEFSFITAAQFKDSELSGKIHLK